jgi:hypothetical protein
MWRKTVELIHLSQDRDKRQAHVNWVMNFSNFTKSGVFLDKLRYYQHLYENSTAWRDLKY